MAGRSFTAPKQCSRKKANKVQSSQTMLRKKIIVGSSFTAPKQCSGTKPKPKLNKTKQKQTKTRFRALKQSRLRGEEMKSKWNYFLLIIFWFSCNSYRDNFEFEIIGCQMF